MGRTIPVKYMTDAELAEHLGSKVSAFPFVVELGGKKVCATGLDKRDYFAGLAMQGFCSQPDSPNEIGYRGASDPRLRDALALQASYAVAWADALIAELAKPKEAKQ